MKKNFYCGLAAFTALAFTACSDDGGANVVAEQGAVNLSSSVIEESSSSVVDASSSSAIAESSSSSFGLSSSDAVSSSSLSNISSSSIAKSSASECGGLHWYGGTDDGVRVPVDGCAESSWPENVVADGVWRIMEMDSDSSCAYCNKDGIGSGKSSIVWQGGESENGEVPDATLKVCGGVCGTAVLDKGTLTFQPFVSIGFTFARDGAGSPVPVDVSNWGGICLSYTSEVPPSLELDLGDSINMKVLNGAVPTASLPKSAAVQAVKCIPWSSFEIPSWFKGDDHGWKEDTGAKAAKQVVGVRFRLQSTPPKDAGGYVFNIRSISAYNSGSGYNAAGTVVAGPGIVGPVEHKN